MPKVSAIIPFYGVAPYVERCVRSLMEQTLPEVEFIFVDDASKDESRAIIERICAGYKRDVKIITHPVNKGLPAARNTGLAHATGDYVFHCDSDDYLEPTMLEDMYTAAVTNVADYVYSDFYLDFGTRRSYMPNPSYTRPEQMIKEGFLAGLMKYNVWNKLVARKLYEGITFPEGHGMGEDMTMILVAAKASRCAHVPKALYHYMKTNAGAFTQTVSEKHREDILYNTQRMLDGLEAWNVPEADKYKALFKLNVKLPFLLSGHRADYRLWREWFPEANKYISQNPHLPRRTRLVQLFAKNGLWPLVWLYAKGVEAYYKLKQD